MARRRPAPVVGVFAASLAAAGVLVIGPAPLAGQTVPGQPNVQVSTYSAGVTLSQPTGMRFLAVDDLLVIEKASGQVKRVTGTGASRTVSTLLDLPVNSDSERGLLGVAIDPDFAANRQVYLYYSRSTTAGDSTTFAGWAENRLSRFTLNAAGTALTGETPLGTFGAATDGGANGPNHDGGPLLFGPDGKLYGITGDLNRDAVEQNYATGTSANSGGIYRLNTDGTVPSDNPLNHPSNDAAFHKWYAYGVRNSFGLAIDPVTGALWDTENGPGSMDEINRVAPGFNSGWEDIMGPDSLDPQGVGDLVQLTGSSYSDPEFSFQNPIGITSIAFLDGSALGGLFPGGVLVGNNNLGTLHRLTLNANRDGFALGGNLADLVANTAAERDQLLFGEDFGVTTDIQVGPDGAVYVLSLSDGAVYRLVPEPGSLALVGVAALALLRRPRTAALTVPRRG